MTDIHVVFQKKTRNGRKMAKLKGSIFYIESEYTSKNYNSAKNYETALYQEIHTIYCDLQITVCTTPIETSIFQTKFLFSELDT